MTEFEDHAGSRDDSTAGQRARKRGILLLAHGSTQRPESGYPARALRTELFYGETPASRTLHRVSVDNAFWKEEPALDTALARIDADDVYIVPLLMSDGFFYRECFPTMLGVPFAPRRWQPHGTQRLYYERPIGEATAMNDTLEALVLEARARLEPTAGEDRTSGEDPAIILVGHGTPRNPHSTREVLRRIDTLRGMLGSENIHAAFLDDEPGLAEVGARVAGDRVVIPWFLDDGDHPCNDIPAALNLPRRPSHQWKTHAVGPHRIVLTPALGASTQLAPAIRARADKAWASLEPWETHARDLRTDRSSPTVNDGRVLQRGKSPCPGPLIALEQVLSQHETHTFGDLVIRADSTLYEAGVYEVRRRQTHATAGAGHVLEAGDARAFERAVIEARSHQRPVPWAQPNERLPAGFVTDDIALVARAIESVYPGTLLAWISERNGLEAPGFEEYTRTLPGNLGALASSENDAVERAVASVCDRHCQRTPRWHRAAETSPNNLPCRAPCHAIYAWLARPGSR